MIPAEEIVTRIAPVCLGLRLGGRAVQTEEGAAPLGRAVDRRAAALAQEG